MNVVKFVCCVILLVFASAIVLIAIGCDDARSGNEETNRKDEWDKYFGH